MKIKHLDQKQTVQGIIAKANSAQSAKIAFSLHLDGSVAALSEAGHLSKREMFRRTALELKSGENAGEGSLSEEQEESHDQGLSFPEVLRSSLTEEFKNGVRDCFERYLLKVCKRFADNKYPVNLGLCSIGKFQHGS